MVSQSIGVRVILLPASYGWADLSFNDGRDERRISCSNIVDTLGDLIRGLSATDSTHEKQEIWATDESRHEALISIRRVGKSLEVIAKRRLLSGRKRVWKTLFRVRGFAVRAVFATALRDAIRLLGAENYREHWGHPLPVGEFNNILAFCSEGEN